MSIVNLAACVLVRNDEYWLPYALQSVSGIFERFVIYDVGSTDRTRDILEWFMEKENKEHGTDFFVRFLPSVDKFSQGAFRNSMIAEARSPTYFLLDGDEIYHPTSAKHIDKAATALRMSYAKDNRMKYGVVRRIEVDGDLKQRYDIKRGHHRLYTSDAIWTGTHPGEEAVYTQNRRSEFDFKQLIGCWHFHNAERSSSKEAVLARKARKDKPTYHPGELVPMNLLEELPILQKPIEDFPVAPALAKLQP